MRWNLISVLVLLSLLLADVGLAQIPTLPDNAQTKWSVNEPEEIVSYLVFDPTTVKNRLPSSLRFITIGELAASYVPWAREHLTAYPTRKDWGISFIEIVRMKTFDIDGHEPNWPDQGAAALWCARVAPSDPKHEIGPGRPLLVLDFWMPDREFVEYMCKKGHYAEYGDVRLQKNSDGKWLGSVEVEGLKIISECVPVGTVEGSGSGGMQALYPPAQSGITSVVRIAFAGHQIQQCNEEGFWKFEGVHPLTKGIVLGPSTFQFGYSLIGGAYDSN